MNQSEFLYNEDAGLSVPLAKRELVFPIPETPGPGEYETFESFNTTQVSKEKAATFAKEKRHALFEDGIDRDVPGPIYTPTVSYTSKIYPNQYNSHS